MTTYEVIVGNIGTVYSGTSRKVASNTYKEYVLQSQRGIGRAGGEDVTMLADGEISTEFAGAISRAAD